MSREPIPAGYEPLAAVLDAALTDAATGKGNRRHARGQPFANQPMAQITAMVGVGFPIGQMMKKAQEAAGMAARGEIDAARRELLGAINYAAGAYLALHDGMGGAWFPNGYTTFYRSIVPEEPLGGTQDGGNGLFRSRWTPETEGGSTDEKTGVPDV